MEISSRVYHWHSQFNVYVLKNKDVLLLSPGQQLLLPQTQFPFVDELDGLRSVDDILATKEMMDERFSLFIYQINKLQEMKLIEASPSGCDYQKPDFRMKPDISVLKHNTQMSEVSLYNFSQCHDDMLKVLESLLLDKKILNTYLADNVALAIFIVDDFLDPRLSEYINTKHFILIKFTGDAISVSPIFAYQDAKLFAGLQKQLLENQPVRKVLEVCYPDACHAYPFEILKALPEASLKAIEKLFIEQIIAKGEDKALNLYRVTTGLYESHTINSALDNDVIFADQINAPIKLESCISHFNIDGGSRNISAAKTVEKLLPLVSPITGVINHLEVIGEISDSPIKIYRTGFFKASNKAELTEFDRNSFVQICLGKGVSHAQSKASALSEAIERYAALYQGDVTSRICTNSQMKLNGFRTQNFQALVPYSQDQYIKFNDPAHSDSSLKQAAKPYLNEAIHWLPTWSLTHKEQVHVPLSQCFSNIPFSDDAFGRWHSNGCAAGNTVEEAILQALFELIERDATAIWWYNKLVCPIFDIKRINSENLSKLDKCLSPDEKSGHNYWVLDLTSDIGIPVMGAIGRDKITGGLVMGFGCHLIPEMAAQRSLTELCQLIPIRDQNAAPFDFDAIEEGEYILGSRSAKTIDYPIEASSDIKVDISTIVERLSAKNMETLALNYSRAHIPLFTAKVFVPGLCHIWPQFANERLYQAPVLMGHFNIAKTEQSINQQALYI